jgi:hypothetical protein
MSVAEAAAPKAGLAKNDVKPMTVRVLGKITRVRRYEKSFFTTVICPAKDEYSKPQIVEIRSKARFGDTEEKCDVMAEVGGYEGKSYQVTDRETGERKSLVPVNIFLDLVE